jgi:hypothetical protein
MFRYTHSLAGLGAGVAGRKEVVTKLLAEPDQAALLSIADP